MLVVGERFLRCVVLVFDRPNDCVLFLLLRLQLRPFVSQGVDPLVRFVLLGLDPIELFGDRRELLAQRFGLGIIQALAQVGQLCLDVVDASLRLLEASEAFALLPQAGDVRQRLFLVHQLHRARVDLLLQPLDLPVDLFDVLVLHAAASVLLLRDPVLQRRVELADLLLHVALGRLDPLLLLPNGREL